MSRDMSAVKGLTRPTQTLDMLPQERSAALLVGLGNLLLAHVSVVEI